jgi:surface protein
MSGMFYANSAFNQDISSWDVSNVYQMGYMFHGDFEQGSSFNQDISSWDVGNVEDMGSMFNWASSFNQDISSWDISNLQQAQFMFSRASSFNQDISSWEFSTIDNFQGFVEYSDLDTNNYDTLLSAFVDQNLLNKSLFAYELFYCNITAREDLINNRGWTIDGDSYNFSIITAPNNISIAPDPSSCVATNIDLGQATYTGGCGVIEITNNSPTEFPIGQTQVIWTLIDGNGIETTDIQTVTVTLQVDVADVCYVSSDQGQVTNNRIFITNDPANSGLNVAYYDVLRESQSGAYESIGFITPPEVSFLDIESNNASQAYRYKIRTTDVCGANYPESSFHKTILLQSGIASDNSINLSWTPYLGLDFTTYNIFKNTNGTGYELLTSLSFNNTTYNDTSANVVDNFYEYYVSIEVASCSSDPLLPFNLRSNLELVNPNLSINNINLLGQKTQIYPNPASDYLNISIPEGVEITAVSIYNALGQRIFVTVEFENIYISNLSTGLYYISINTNKGVVNKTMIRE